MSIEDITDNELKGSTRRDFLRFMGLGGLRLGLLGGANLGAAAIQNSWTDSEKELKDHVERGQNNLKAYQTGEVKTLEVKDFSPYIVHAAHRIAYKEDNLFLKLGAGYLMGDGFGGFVLRKQSEKTNKIIGSASFLSGKVIDLVSTYIGTKEVENPKFKKYGLEHYFGEQNPFFPKHPNKWHLLLIGSPIAFLSAVGGYIFPSIGRGYLGLSPVIANSNTQVGDTISLALDLGDRIQVMIDDKKTTREIFTYLKNVKK